MARGPWATSGVLAELCRDARLLSRPHWPLWLLEAQPRNTWSVPSAPSGPASPAQATWALTGPSGSGLGSCSAPDEVAHLACPCQGVTSWDHWRCQGEISALPLRTVLGGGHRCRGAGHFSESAWVVASGKVHRIGPMLTTAASERALSWRAVVTEAPGFPPMAPVTPHFHISKWLKRLVCSSSQAPCRRESQVTLQ